MTDKIQDETIKSRIIALLGKGYTRSQLINDLNFAERTVDAAIKEYKELNQADGVDTKEGTRPNADDTSSLPPTLKNTEVITPEGIIQRCLRDGSKDWELRLEGMMLLRAAQRMNMDDVEIMKGQAEANAKMLKPILEVMIEASREQDAAARRVYASNMEIAQTAAQQAAMGVASQLSPEVQALKSQIAQISSPDPVSRMLNLMQSIPLMLQTSQELMHMFGMPASALPPFGGQTGSQGQSQSGTPQAGPQANAAQQSWSPLPIERHSIRELEENDVGQDDADV